MKAAANTFVLDASVALAWCFDDESSDLADDILDLLKGGSQAITPGIWPLEVANVVLMAERRKRISVAKIMEQLGEIRKLPILVEPADSSRAFDQILSVARQLRLTVYDAAYLELAMRRALPLATLDDSVRRAARQAGIPLVSV
jgi:predicted nucleic acid-binding protein